MDFKGRVAIVTGGTGALGRAVALDLLAAGARVHIPYYSETEWAALGNDSAASRSSLAGSKTDVTQAEEVKRFVQDVIALDGRLDFLLAIAGGFAAGKSFETEDSTWDRMIDLNLRSVLLSLRYAVPEMIRKNYGRIVTVSSSAILRGGGAGVAAYAVSKGAVRQLTEILADEVRDHNIHVHSVMPGTMDTPANRKAMPKADFSEWVKVEDVARVIHFLLGDDARAIRSVAVPVLA
jgi:NAD(P)-dependent dehydrogenase (short-subunit alcohol dehydrogenase family)